MSKPRQNIIVLHGGPLDGIVHEIEKDWPMPDAFALPKDGYRYWYKTNKKKGTAIYMGKATKI